MSKTQPLFDITPWQNQAVDMFTEALIWFQQNFLEPTRLIELAIILSAVLVSRIATKFFRNLFESTLRDKTKFHWLKIDWLLPITGSLVALLFLYTALLILDQLGAKSYLLPIASSLLAAWLAIRIIVVLLPNKELGKIVATLAWTLAALNIIGLLSPMLTVLSEAKLPIGESDVSALDILRGLFTLGILMWLGLGISRLMETRIKQSTTIPASVVVLIAKTSKIILLVIAFLVAIDTTGIDLTVLAVFGGALGVGLGFGLQKVVSNFISGLILLLDRSIKPGDVVEIDETYGRINRLAARYTSVITRDGTEFLIPNENMITQPVVNWSHSDRLVRRHIPVQVSYNSDLEKAMALMCEAALEEPRVLKMPEPKTLLRGFGDSGVNLELRLWIEDPQHGVSNMASGVMLRIWHKFHAEGIEFPFPHRVVKLEPQGPLETIVRMADPDPQ